MLFFFAAADVAAGAAAAIGAWAAGSARRPGPASGPRSGAQTGVDGSRASAQDSVPVALLPDRPAGTSRSRPAARPAMVVILLCGWPRRCHPRWSSCSAACPCSRRLRAGDLERIAQLAVPREFEPGQVVFREGDASDTCYIVRTGHARAVRQHSRRAHDHAGQLRAGRHLRRAGDVRGRASLGHGRGARAHVGGRPAGPGHAPPDGRASRHHDEAGDRPRPPPAREQRASRAPVLSDRAEPGGDGAARARRPRPGPRPRRTATCW